jgi:hypothetical protein
MGLSCKESGLKGDVVECGVGRGTSYYQLGHFMDRLSYSVKLYGFDSFEGFPDPSEQDDSPRKPKRGEWGDTSISHIEGHFIERGLGRFFDESCILVPGFFEQTIMKGDLPMQQISLLHLDVDLYQSYKTCGIRLIPLVVQGGVVIYDDYKAGNWPGATKAIDEIVDSFGHQIYYSEVMNKHFSLTEDPPIELIEILQARPVV